MYAHMCEHTHLPDKTLMLWDQNRDKNNTFCKLMGDQSRKMSPCGLQVLSAGEAVKLHSSLPYVCLIHLFRMCLTICPQFLLDLTHTYFLTRAGVCVKVLATKPDDDLSYITRVHKTSDRYIMSDVCTYAHIRNKENNKVIFKFQGNINKKDSIIVHCSKSL